MIKRNKTNDETLFDAFMEENHPEVKKLFSWVAIFVILGFGLKAYVCISEERLTVLLVLILFLCFVYATYDFVKGLFYSDWLDH